MDKGFFRGKTVGEVIDDNTVILTKLTEDELESIKCKDIVSYGVTSNNNIAVFQDYTGMNVVIVYVDDEPKALFYIYELHGVVISKERMFVLAYGHEDILIYWINDGELTEIGTR